MKKTIALVLALTLMCAAMAACSGNGGKNDGGSTNDNTTQNGTAQAEVDKAATTEKPKAPDKVVLYLVSFNNVPENTTRVTDKINAYIAEKYPDANVELSLSVFSISEYFEKVMLAAQSGTQMDIFTAYGTVFQNIAQGLVMPIGDILDVYGKEMSAKIDADMGEGVSRAVKMNGKVYGVPVNKGFAINETFIFDQAMFDATGISLDSINSVFDLEPLFAKVKELYPDVYPFVNMNASDSGIMFSLAFDKKVETLGDRDRYMGVVIGDNSKVVNLYETPEFKEYISLMRDWFQKGYVPTDMATSQSAATELFAAKRAFSTMGTYGGNSIGTLISMVEGRPFGTKIIGQHYTESTSVSLVSMCVSSNSKVPEAAVKMLNLIYTDEFVQNTILFGIEGEDYVKVDEHHWAYPEGKDPNSVAYTAAYSTGVIGSESIQYQSMGMPYEDVMLKLRQNVESPRSPYYQFAFDQMPVINELTALTNVFSQYMPGLICGSLDPETAIPQYVAALKAAGIDTVIAEKQKQLDAWIAAN